MTRLGHGDRAKRSARCPFHQPDNHPSFSVFVKDGQHYWKCHAGCGEGDAIDFLAKARGIDTKEATKEFLRLAGIGRKTPAVAPAANEQNGPSITPRPLAGLLDAVSEALRRYVTFPMREQADAIALWVAHTWAFAAAEFTPYLAVTAPSKRSGKSRVLE